MIALSNTARHAGILVDLLVDCGPLTGAECCAKLGWSRGRFDAALKYARNELCPEYGMAIPHPTPDDGWRYQITVEWAPVEAGASYSMGNVETRLASIHRDVRIVRPHLDPRSKAGRRANFLDKHLAHLLATLKEINGG